MLYARVLRVLSLTMIIITSLISPNYIFRAIASEGGGVPIKLITVVWAPHFFAFLAQDKGFFEKNNVNVQVKLIPDYIQALKSYEDGDFDGIFEVYSDAIIQESQGIDTNVVYNTDLSDTGDVIVGNGTNLSDFKGKTVSVEGINSYSHLFLIRALQSIGMDEGDIRLINLPATNVTKALEKGEISAGYTYQPYTQDALKHGYSIIFTAGRIPGTISDVIAFHSNVVAKRPDAVSAIVRSFAEAQEYYNDNKVESLKIMSNLTGVSVGEIAQGLNQSKAQGLTDNYLHSMKNSNESASLYNSGKFIVNFFIDRGQITEYPNLSKIIDPQFVSSIVNSNRGSSDVGTGLK